MIPLAIAAGIGGAVGFLIGAALGMGVVIWYGEPATMPIRERDADA